MSRRALQFTSIAILLLAISSAPGAALHFLRAPDDYRDESIADVAGDGAGNAFVCGFTSETKAKAPAISVSQYQSGVGFVARLSSSGETLSQMAFRGTDEGGVSRIAVDKHRRVIAAGVGGKVFTSDFGSPRGSPRVAGIAQIFVVRLDASGTNVLSKTFFGSNGAFKTVSALAVDAADNIFVAGYAIASAFPDARRIGSMAANTTHPFIAKLDARGTVQYVTMFGGSSEDYVESIALNAAGEVYAAGSTYSLDFPRTFGGTSTSDNLYYNAQAYVVKLAADGSSFASSILLGGDCYAYANALAVDQAGAVYVVGSTCYTDLPGVTPEEASQAVFQGGFVTKLDATGTNVVFTKLLGYTGRDAFTAIQPRDDGTMLLAGMLNSDGLSGAPFVATLDRDGNLGARSVAPRCSAQLTLARMTVDAAGQCFIVGLSPVRGKSFAARSYAARLQAPEDLNSEPPQLLVTAPAPNSIIGTNENVGLSAIVIGAPTSNVVVQFFDGRRILGAGTEAPYSLIVSNWQPGRHLISVSARVNGQSLAGSCAVPVRVRSPRNDRFENSIHKTGEHWTAVGTVAGATPDPMLYSYARDVWWSWTAPRDGAFEVRATRGFGINVAAYTGTMLTNLTEVASSSFFNGPATFKATSGTTYHFQISSYYLSAYMPTRPFRIQLGPTTTPANDDFANAVELSGVPVEANGTLAHATHETGEPGFNPVGSVWFNWTVPESGLYVATVESSSQSASVSAYTGDAVDGLTARGSEIGASAYGTAFYAQRGEAIRLAVSSYNAGTNFLLRITPRSPPPNDDFTNDTELAGVPVSTNGTTIGATIESGEPYTYAGTVWWKWTAPTAGVYRVAIQVPTPSGSGGIALLGFASLSVYSGNQLDDLFTVAGSSSGRIAFHADAGVTYHIAVATSTGSDFSFSIVPATPPSNDDFSAAEILDGSGVRVTGTLRDATLEPGEPQHSWFSSAGGSVWYGWTAPSNGTFAIRIAGGGASLLDIFAGDRLPSLVPVARATTRQVIRATAAAKYRIAAYSDPLWSAPLSENFTLYIDSVTPPPNDDLANASVLTGTNVTFEASGYNATSEPNDPLGDHSVWWTWTAPIRGGYVVRSADYATLRVFLRTTNSQLQLIANGGGTNLAFTAESGATYFIGAAVNVEGLTHYSLFFVPAPVNDDFENATTIAALPVTITGSTDGATSQSGERYGAAHSVWWTWTSPVDQAVVISATTDGFTASVSIYSGTALTNLAVFSTYGGAAVFHAAAGVTYHIAVDAESGSGNFSLTLMPIAPPSNDAFASRLPMTNNTAAGSISGATIDPDERYPNGGSVWWRWRAPTSGWFLVEASAASFDLHTGDTLTNLPYIWIETFPREQLGVPTSPFDPQKRAFYATEGTDYVLRVSAPLESTGDYMVRFTYWPQPINDNFSNRIALAGAPVTASATNTIATIQSGEPGWFYSERLLWWSWTPASNGAYSVSVWRSPAASEIDIYTGSVLTNLTAPRAAYPNAARLLIHADAAVTYAIRATPNLNATPSYTYGKVILDIASANAPPNDDFVNRAGLTGNNVTVHGSNREATAEPDEPRPAALGPWSAQSVWYTWTPDADGTATIDVTSTHASFGIVVYTGTVLTNLQVVATNRYDLPPLQFQATAGIRYPIWIDGASSDAGDFQLSVALEASPSAAPVTRVARELVVPNRARQHAVEASTDLIHWTPFRTNIEDLGEIRLPIGSEPQRFFRLR